MFSHCFLLQLSKLQLDSLTITCDFLHFKASELLDLQDAEALPTDAFLLPLISCYSQKSTKCYLFMGFAGQWIQDPPRHTAAEQDLHLPLQHTNPIYSFLITP